MGHPDELARRRRLTPDDLDAIATTDRWGRQVTDELLSSPSDAPFVAELLALCARATSTTPSRRWLADRSELVARASGCSTVASQLLQAFVDTDLREGERAAIERRTAAGYELIERIQVERQAKQHGTLAHIDDHDGRPPMHRFVDRVNRQIAELPPAPSAAELFGSANGDLLRGATWVLGDRGTPDPEQVAALLGAVARHGVDVNRGLEPGTEVVQGGKVVNAAITTLGTRGDDAAIAQLVLLKQAIRNKHHVRILDKALAAAAEASGRPLDELLAAAVPTFGLRPDGGREDRIGDVVARIAVTPRAAVQVAWERDGTRLRSRPTDLAPADELVADDLVAEAKQLRAFVAAEVARLEDLLSDPRGVAIDRWWARHVDHPVTRQLATHLVWWADVADEPAVAFLPEADGATGAGFDATGASITLDPTATIRAWHPVDAPANEVEAWAERLRARRITQPFDQVGRSCHRPGTTVAGVALDYRPLWGLLKRSAWSSAYLGAWDGGDRTTAARVFAGAGLRAEVPIIATEDPAERRRVDDVELGPLTFSRLATDDADDPFPIDQVPAAVYSEAMRDVTSWIEQTAKR